jgi:hypothetical protein
MGPVSFVRFGTFKHQGSQELQLFVLLEMLLSLCKDLLANLMTVRVDETQIHEPWDIECEHDILAQPLGSVLAFAKRKLKEVSDVCLEAAGHGNLDGFHQAWQLFLAKRQGNSEVALSPTLFVASSNFQGLLCRLRRLVRSLRPKKFDRLATSFKGAQSPFQSILEPSTNRLQR